MQITDVLTNLEDGDATDGSTLDASAMQVVVFNVGDQSYGINIQHVREIRAWTPATVIPQAPAFVRGVINLRGLIVPIIDLRATLDQGFTEPTSGHVIIIIMVGKRVAGILVDSVLDIVGANDNDIKAIPTGGTSSSESCLDVLLTRGEHTIIIVSPEKLLQTMTVN